MVTHGKSVQNGEDFASEKYSIPQRLFENGYSVPENLRCMDHKAIEAFRKYFQKFATCRIDGKPDPIADLKNVELREQIFTAVACERDLTMELHQTVAKYVDDHGTLLLFAT